MVARRTPHLNSASGLDATKWCKNARSLLRRSDTTSGRMCSAFFCRKSWRTRRTTINMLHTFSHTEGATVFSGEGSALIVHLFRMFKDFPTAVSVTLTVIYWNSNGRILLTFWKKDVSTVGDYTPPWYDIWHSQQNAEWQKSALYLKRVQRMDCPDAAALTCPTGFHLWPRGCWRYTKGRTEYQYQHIVSGKDNNTGQRSADRSERWKNTRHVII